MKRKLISMVIPCLLIMALLVSPLFVDNRRTMAKAESTESYVSTAENVEALSGGYNSVRLRWDNLEGTREYAIYRSEQPDGAYERITKLSNTDCSYTDKNLTTGTTYFYKVARRVGSASVSGNLNLVDVVQATPELDSPKVVGKAISRARIKLSWKHVPGAKKYIVYKYSKKQKKYNCIKTVTNKKRYYKDVERKPGTGYKYKICAVRNTTRGYYRSKDSSLWVRTPKKLTQMTPGFERMPAGAVIRTAYSKMGCKYRLGKSGPKIFDCSGFTCWTMQNAKVRGKLAAGLKMPRLDSRTIYSDYHRNYGVGKKLELAQPGDIIIISKTGNPDSIYHVGIYYDEFNKGHHRYIHANGTKVTIGKIPEKMVVDIIRMPGLDIK